jgi:hypothetical protein
MHMEIFLLAGHFLDGAGILLPWSADALRLYWTAEPCDRASSDTLTPRHPR